MAAYITYISSTEIHFKIGAKLFVYLEAAGVTKQDQSTLLCLFAFYGTHYSLLQQCFLSDLFHWPILICHSNSGDKQDRKGQHLGILLFRIKADIFLCLIVSKKKKKKNEESTTLIHTASNL